MQLKKKEKKNYAGCVCIIVPHRMEMYKEKKNYVIFYTYIYIYIFLL